MSKNTVILGVLTIATSLLFVFSACNNTESGMIITDDPGEAVYLEPIKDVQWENNNLGYIDRLIAYKDFIVAMSMFQPLKIIEPSSGKILWKTNMPNSFKGKNIFLHNNALYLSHLSEGGKYLLKKYDFQTGELLKTIQLDDDSYTTSTSGNMLIGDTYYCLLDKETDSTDIFLKSFNLKTGEENDKINVNIPNVTFEDYAIYGLSVTEDQKRAFISSSVQYTGDYSFMVKEVSLENNKQSIIYSTDKIYDANRSRLLIDDSGRLIALIGRLYNFKNVDMVVLESNEPYSIINEEKKIPLSGENVFIRNNLLYNPMAPVITYDYLAGRTIDRIEFLGGELKFSSDGNYVLGYNDDKLSIYDLDHKQIITKVGKEPQYRTMTYGASPNFKYALIIHEYGGKIVAYRLPDSL